MHRIDGPGATVDNKFTDGDPVGGVQATVVTAPWLNDLQENVIAVLVAAGITPTKGRTADLLDSIKKVGVGRLLRTTIYINNAGTLRGDLSEQHLLSGTTQGCCITGNDALCPVLKSRQRH